MKQWQLTINFADAIQWLESSLEIFHDEPPQKQENIRNLARLLEAMTQDDVDRLVYDLVAEQPAIHEIEESAPTEGGFGPQEPPQDYRFFNRRQPDGAFRPLSEFFEVAP